MDNGPPKMSWTRGGTDKFHRADLDGTGVQDA